jgi:hypothetical protein
MCWTTDVGEQYIRTVSVKGSRLMPLKVNRSVHLKLRMVVIAGAVRNGACTERVPAQNLPVHDAAAATCHIARQLLFRAASGVHKGPSALASGDGASKSHDRRRLAVMQQHGMATNSAPPVTCGSWKVSSSTAGLLHSTPGPKYRRRLVRLTALIHSNHTVNSQHAGPNQYDEIQW